MEIIGLLVVLCSIQFVVGLLIGSLEKGLLPSLVASIAHLILSPVLVYSLEGVALAFLGYFVSEAGILIFLSALCINFLGWNIGRRFDTKLFYH